MADDTPFCLLINPDVANANPTSLGYIAANVLAHGFAAEVIDFADDRPSPAALADLLRTRRPALVGVSSYQAIMPQVLDVVRFVRRLCDAKIVLGGPQIPGMPDRALAQLDGVDYLCRADGELVTVALMQAIANRRAIDLVPGMSAMVDGQVVTTAAPAAPADLDAYPSPYLTGVLGVGEPSGEPVLLFTSRGCPFSCSFCVTPFLSNRRLRFHSLDRVIEEITFLYSQGARRFWFADPLFSARKERVHELCERIIATGLPIRFWCETRSDLVDRELLTALKRAGVEKMAFGMESANQVALDLMHKQQDIGRFTEVVKSVQAMGIEVELLQIVGAPGETYESIMRTFDHVRSLGIYFSGNNGGNLYRIDFGSEVSRDPDKHGLIVPRRVRSQSYPAYLSPGDHVRARSLTAAQWRKVTTRLVAERTLATIKEQIDSLHAATGLAARDLLALPDELRTLMHGRFMADQPIDWHSSATIDQLAVWASNDRPVLPIELDRWLEAASYGFNLTWLGDDDQGLLGSPDLVDVLVERLAASELHDAAIAFRLPLRFWRANAARLTTILRRFRVRHSSPGGASGHRQVARLVALLDLSATSDVDGGEVAQLRQVFGLEGYNLLPFFRFAPSADVGDFTRRLARLHADGKLESCLVTGIATHSRVDELVRVYAAPPGRSWSLPPLRLFGRGTLIHGAARVVGQRTSSTPVRRGRWLDRSGSHRAEEFVTTTRARPRAAAVARRMLPATVTGLVRLGRGGSA